jgi:RDD family
MTGSSTSAVERRPADFGSRIKALGLTALLVVATLVVGWLAWSVVEWTKGRTASYHVTGLRIVRRSDGRPIGLVRSVLRNAILCTLLLVPTIVACLLIGFAFTMGASPPDRLLRKPRAAPWDVLTGTEVVFGAPLRRRDQAWMAEIAGNDHAG